MDAINQACQCASLTQLLAQCFRATGASLPEASDAYQATHAVEAVHDPARDYDELVKEAEAAIALMHKLEQLPDNHALVKAGGRWTVMQSGKGFDSADNAMQALTLALTEIIESES